MLPQLDLNYISRGEESCTLVRRVCMRDIRRLALGGSEGLDPCRSTYKTALARTVWLLEACRAYHRPA